MSLAPRKLRVEFSTEAAFRSEYLSNIHNGGIFVASEEAFEVREAVLVELNLAYREQRVELPGEVVHCIPPEMVEAGGLPGVAIQFTLDARDLRAGFEPMVGVVEGNERITRSGRRTAPRSPARVPLEVTHEGSTIECRTRDISSSGMLVSLEGAPIPIGAPISMVIFHPQADEQMQIDGTVVRHVSTEAGEVTAMGVEFHLPEARQTEIAQFMTDVRAAEHSRRLGGITGPISALGIENLLQMLGSSSTQGTLAVTRSAEEGFILFEAGMLIAARVGRLSGREALKSMLSWREGSFEFHSRLEDIEPDPEEVPLEAAILEALCDLDEDRRPRDGEGGDLSSLVDEDPLLDLDLDDDERSGAQAPPRRAGITPETIFEVDAERAFSFGGELGQTEEAVLDLAGVGMPVARMLEVIPEPEPDVYAALEALLKQGLISRRADA